MKHTQKYQLTQWEKQDRIQMEAFNSDNAKLEAALAAASSALSAETAARTAALALKGNCQLFVTSYTGTGKFGGGTPVQVTFPAPPDFVVVYAAQYFRVMFFRAGQATACNMDTRSNYTVSLRWQGNTVSWASSIDANAQLNSSGETYTVAAFYRMDNN